MNAYLPGELYERIREIAFHEKRSMSNIIADEAEKFVLASKEIERRPSDVKDEPQCATYRMEDRKKIGVYLSAETRIALNDIAEREHVTVAGIFRVLASRYVNEYEIKQKNAKMNTSYFPPTENSFQMYIDLT